MPARHIRWILFATVIAVASFANAQEMAIVAKRVIYPGQTISVDALSRVDASNCSNCDAGYIQDALQVTGKIAVKTIIPGKLIFPEYVRSASAVMPGKEVDVLFQKGSLSISMRGLPLSEAGSGESVSVRNRESGTIIVGIVQPDGTVKVSP